MVIVLDWLLYIDSIILRMVEAVFFQLNFLTLSRPFMVNFRLRSWFSMIAIIFLVKFSSFKGSTIIAAPAEISLTDWVFGIITGTPHAMASMVGNPNPS